MEYIPSAGTNGISVYPNSVGFVIAYLRMRAMREPNERDKQS